MRSRTGGDQAAPTNMPTLRACGKREIRSPADARLRSWMEGWRITCPICGAALEDFRLYTRLFRADPSDALLVRIESSAREGEQNHGSQLRGGAAVVQPMPR